jgi:glyoxylase-like metal-dependent hydrolase (beta-lactamase superfamily II)
MSEMSFPEPDAPVGTTAPDELKARIDAGEEVAILDARATSEYDAWQIDGPNVADANVPYFRFLEGVTDDLLEQVPDDDDLVVVCAKGQASEYVAGILNEEGYEATNLEDGMNGWARLYEHTDVVLDTGATVRQYRRPSSGCLAYMIYDDEAAVVVDPLREFTDRYVADAADLGVEITAVLDTHVHADHVSGVRELAAETGADLLLPEAAVARGIDYDADFETVADGDELAVGSATVEALSTPGHTSGMTSYLVDGEVLLTGDTLFVDSVARPDLEEGDEGAPDAAAQLYETLQDRVLALGDETLIGAAHFGPNSEPREDGAYLADIATVTDEIDLLSVGKDEFVDRVLADMPPRPANYGEIIATNLGQQTADDDEAFELELGPNNCAASE